VSRRRDGATALTAPRSATRAMSAYEDAVRTTLGALARALDAKRCDATLEGAWKLDVARSESLGPFLRALGAPRIATPIADNLPTTVTVKCDDDGRGFAIVDATALSSRNETRARFDGAETLRTTRGGRKRFYLSGDAREGALVIVCRLFERGEGWATEQIRGMDPSGSGMLRERNVLKRPNGEPDVVVDRFFRRVVD
jgi:hypothetical protein